MTSRSLSVLGRPVRGSQSGRPIMALLDILGQRWTLRILWELRDGAVGFRDLAARATRCRKACSTVVSRNWKPLAW